MTSGLSGPRSGLSGLNRDQLDAAVQIHGALLVVAGAGTGKTRVITLRIAHMIQCGILPSCIVGLSFTNKAAHEMQERLGGLVGMSVARKVTLSTFHAFALGIIKEFPYLAGLKPGFRIIDEADAFSLLRESVHEAGVADFFSVVYFKEKISGLKDSLLLAEDIGRQKNFVDGVLVAQVFDAYTRRLRLYNLVDFDDLVYLSWRILNENSQVTELLRRRWTHFLVDEYQDTSQGQFEFLRTLLSSKANVCAVGDDDQSIYSWRGANPRVLRLFLETFDQARRVTLDQNYRCSPVILEAANAVIHRNDDRLDKSLWSERTDRDLIRIFTAESAVEEASYVAETIKNLMERGAPGGQFAVLYRSNVLTQALENAFVTLGVPYHLSGGTQMSDRREIRDLLSLMGFALDPKDLRSLFRALDVMGAGLKLGEQEQFAQQLFAPQLFEQGVEPYDAKQVNFKEHLLRVIKMHGTQISEQYSKLIELVEYFQKAVSMQALADVYETWFEKSDFRDKLRKESPSMQNVLNREEFVGRFFGVIRKMKSFSEDQSESVLQQVYDRFQMRSRESKSNLDENKVQLLTIHSSKGLEFEHVFLVGLEEGIIPHERSLQESSGRGDREERRLMYVAMTRAKKKLYLSHALFRKGNQGAKGSKRMQQTTRSRFLNDIPEHLLELDTVRLLSAEAKRAEAARKLFDMFR